MAKINVTKIEAAQRQIDAAIRMLFANEDPVAIHSIAAAGSRILRDFAKQKQTDVWKMMDDCIRPEMRQKFWGGEGMNRFANFLKHADIDPTEIIDDVDDTVNDYMIFFACLLYQDLGHSWTPEMATFIPWYVSLHPSHCREDLPWVKLIEQWSPNWRDLPRHEQMGACKAALDSTKKSQ